MLEPQELESESITMVVDRVKYYDVKLDRIDEKQICFIDKWVDSFLRRAEYNMKRLLDPEVLKVQRAVLVLSDKSHVPRCHRSVA